MNFKDELEKSVPEKINLTEQEKAMIRYRVRQSHTSKFHVKPLIIAVLFIMIVAVLVLPSIQSIKKEESASNQMDMSVSNYTPSPITENQKQQYYEQYIKIVERAKEQNFGLPIDVAPMDKFTESDWVEPKEYEKMIQNMVYENLATEREILAALATNLKPAVTHPNGETTKALYVYFVGIVREIEVTANFDTQYSTYHDGQLFASVDNISTQLASSSPGTWEQTSYEASLIDGGRTYRIHIEGIFELSNLSFEKAFTIEFSCDKYGNIY